MASEQRQKRRRALNPFPSYIFRGDTAYRRGPVGLPLESAEAQAAHIQNPADHVLRKESGKTSIYIVYGYIVCCRAFWGAKMDHQGRGCSVAKTRGRRC